VADSSDVVRGSRMRSSMRCMKGVTEHSPRSFRKFNFTHPEKVAEELMERVR
jgi:hypothetical protein